MTPFTVGFAIVGCGPHAFKYADAIQEHPDARLLTVHSRSEQAARDRAEQYQCIGTTDYESILKDPEVSVVVFANEPGRHIMAVDAAHAAKHVIVEKPLAETYEDGHAIVEACRRNQVIAGSGLHLRLNTSLNITKDLIDKGRLGEVNFVNMNIFSRRTPDSFERGGGWRKGIAGGVVLGYAVHNFDFLLGLLGPVMAVNAVLSNPLNIGTDNYATITMKFSNNVFANININGVSQELSGDSFAIYGDKAAIWIDYSTVNINRYPFEYLNPQSLKIRRFLKSKIKSFLKRERTSFTYSRGNKNLLIDDFISSVKANRQPKCSLSDNFAVLKIALAAHQSSEKREWVDVL
tara:strand:- start:64 stop:1110 length:1047 start_codon:yes stop_codon:yes gene_type:complete